MSFLSSEIAKRMDEKKIHPAELSRLTGISEATISRLLNNKTDISPEHLEELCHALGKNLREKAGLLRAHLLDQCQGPGSELIQIHIAREPMMLVDSGNPPLSPKLEAAFATLRENIHDQDLQQILVGLATMCRTKDSQP